MPLRADVFGVLELGDRGNLRNESKKRFLALKLARIWMEHVNEICSLEFTLTNEINFVY